jgi:hydrogenase maturation factor
MRRIERENIGNLRPGQDLVIAGYAGLSGTIEIVKEKKDELLPWFSKEYINTILEMEAIVNQKYPESWKQYGAAEWEPAGKGGIFKTLWDLSGAYLTGIRFSLRKIPVKQETIEICERYDLNPYRLFSNGCVLLAAEHGGDLADALKHQGIDAVVIGKVTNGIKRIIDHGETIGYLDRPTEDEIYKI